VWPSDVTCWAGMQMARDVPPYCSAPLLYTLHLIDAAVSFFLPCATVTHGRQPIFLSRLIFLMSPFLWRRLERQARTAGLPGSTAA